MLTSSFACLVKRGTHNGSQDMLHHPAVQMEASIRVHSSVVLVCNTVDFLLLVIMFFKAILKF